MVKTLFSRTNGDRPWVIGMLHLAPLPGSPRYNDNLNWVRERLLRDVDALNEGGVDALIMENFGDVPFFPDRVPSQVVAHMTALALTVKQHTELPLGINCLRNDGVSALAIAHAAEADFIRVNVLVGARVTDQGVIEGIAHTLLRERDRLQARNIRILADIDVKHSSALGEPRSMVTEARETLERGLADAVIVSGEGTGYAANLDDLAQVRGAIGEAPLIVGSGVSAETVREYAAEVDGMIVGTSLKKDRIATNPVELTQVNEFMARLAD